MILKLHLCCILAVFINLNCIPANEIYTSIVWDPANPLFIDGSDNCPHKYKRLKVHSASKISFICPNVGTLLKTSLDDVSKANMYENLWLLYNKESFDKCDTTLDVNVTKPALSCNTPRELNFHSITFQPHATLPDEVEFQKGHSYYIIATSNGKESGIGELSGGHCNDTTKNVSMKIEVYVCNSTHQDKDPMCQEGVGELTCPSDDTSSSSSVSTPTPSTPHTCMLSSTPSEATTTQIPTPTATVRATEKTTCSTGTTQEQSKNEPQKGDSNEESKTAWMVTAFVFMVICVAIVIAFIGYRFCLGKKTSCELNEKRKVEPSPQYGRKNLAFENAHDSLTREETGSIPDKQTGILIYNKEVFYSKEDMGKNEQENPPV